jgi:hypothetical protein
MLNLQRKKGDTLHQSSSWRFGPAFHRCVSRRVTPANRKRRLGNLISEADVLSPTSVCSELAFRTATAIRENMSAFLSVHRCAISPYRTDK